MRTRKVSTVELPVTLEEIIGVIGTGDTASLETGLFGNRTDGLRDGGRAGGYRKSSRSHEKDDLGDGDHCQSECRDKLWDTKSVW